MNNTFLCHLFLDSDGTSTDTSAAVEPTAAEPPLPPPTTDNNTKDMQATKTPPNTPTESRTSPVTVRQADGDVIQAASGQLEAEANKQPEEPSENCDKGNDGKPSEEAEVEKTSVEATSDEPKKEEKVEN